jgi:AraC-like DNA-binding protein
MALLYPEEHTSCYNYNSTDPTFEHSFFKEGECLHRSSIYTRLTVLLKGEIRLAVGVRESREIRQGWIIIVPAGYPLEAEFLQDSELLTIQIKREVSLCERFSLQKLTEGRALEEYSREPAFLPVNERMESFIRSMLVYVDDGLKCYYFFDAKISELFFNFRAYYPKEDLLRFFRSVLHEDSQFANYVIAQSAHVKTVKELARQVNYSPSGFDKKFRKMFHVSARQWLKQEQARRIFHEIHSDKPLKQISTDYGFSSPSRFNDFCKDHFGAPPGRLRKCSRE